MNTRALAVGISQWRHVVLVSVLVLGGIGLPNSETVKAQTPAAADKTAAADVLTGKYEGVAKSAKAVETRLTLELVNEKGKITGRLVTPDGSVAITDGSFAENKLALKFGEGNTASMLSAQLQGDKLTGDWAAGGQKQTVELKRTAAEAPANTSAAPVTLTGEWDGIADNQGQGFPFVLILKVDGEKVTGESNSSLGQATVSSGTFKDGKLVFQLDSQGGPIFMSAVIKDGGLVGEFDYAGQAQGRWVAKKRTP